MFVKTSKIIAIFISIKTGVQNMSKKILIDLSGKEEILYDDEKIIDITSECLNIDKRRIRIYEYC
jgi:Holliday junction resolvase RusA-like endonuclease